jgi:hypothetical protein
MASVSVRVERKFSVVHVSRGCRLRDSLGTRDESLNFSFFARVMLEACQALEKRLNEKASCAFHRQSKRRNSETHSTVARHCVAEVSGRLFDTDDRTTSLLRTANDEKLSVDKRHAFIILNRTLCTFPHVSLFCFLVPSPKCFAIEAFNDVQLRGCSLFARCVHFTL